MLGVIRLWAVLIGTAGGALVAAVVFMLGLVATRAFGTGELPGIFLTVSLIAGLIGGGFLAGRLAPVNGRFHGSIAGLGMAALVIVVARLGGSPAPTGEVLLLALIAIVVGGVAGRVGGRRRYNGGNEPTG